MKGQFAKAVYGYELLLAELYGQGVFEKLDEISLGVIAVSAVFEPRKNQRFPSGLSKETIKAKQISEQIYFEARRKETRAKIYPFSKAPHFHLAKTIEMWMRGEKFSRIIQLTDTDEGEVVRYFRMAIQILREIKDAPISPTLETRINKALHIINRDIIDAEKQLREG